MGLAGTIASSFILDINMSEKITDTGPPIGHPSICFIKWKITEKTHSFVNFTNFLKIVFLQNSLFDLST